MADWTHNYGVTLVEMLVVLGIIVVLASFAVTLTLRMEDQSKENSLHGAFAVLGTALREYHDATGEFPPQPERLAVNALGHIEDLVHALRSLPESREVLNQLDPALTTNEIGLVDVPELRDPWGTQLDYIYAAEEGDTFPELVSAGPDRRFGTADDISSKGNR